MEVKWEKVTITAEDIVDDNNRGIETIRESIAKTYPDYERAMILKYHYPPRKIFMYLIYDWKCRSHIRKKQMFKAVDLCSCIYYSDLK